MNDATDAREIARLRARIAELEAERSQALQGTDARGRRRPRGAGRATAATVLLVLACVLAPVSVISVWASSVLSDTDRYVETVAPVADDPAVQSAIAAEVTTAIMDELDVEGLTVEALDALAQQDDVPPRVAQALPALAVPLTSGIESFTLAQTERLLASDQFAQLWAEANRISHDQVVTLLEGNESGAVSAQGDTITLNLAPIIAAVKDRLVAAGFDLAANVPEVDRSFVLVENDGISQAQQFYGLLNALGLWLPFAVIALFAAGVLTARDRRRALLRGSLGVTVAMVSLGVLLIVVRVLYVETTPAGLLTPEAAGNVFDTLVRFLRTGMRTAAVLGLLVALAAFLTGPSNGAVRTRRALTQGIGTARSRSEEAGWDTGAFGSWVHRRKKALRVGAFVVAGLVLMSWEQPTVTVVLVAALLTVLVLGAIEFLARPPVAAAVAGFPEQHVSAHDAEPTKRLEVSAPSGRDTPVP